MNLEQQVCSLELAKKLKELGVKQESLFCWAQIHVYSRDDGEWSLEFEEGLRGKSIWTSVSAFTVAELGEMLPKRIDNGDPREPMAFDLNLYCVEHLTHTDWHVGYWWDEDTRRSSGMKIEDVYADTEADARAKMLIYLLENKLITA